MISLKNCSSKTKKYAIVFIVVSLLTLFLGFLPSVDVAVAEETDASTESSLWDNIASFFGLNNSFYADEYQTDICEKYGIKGITTSDKDKHGQGSFTVNWVEGDQTKNDQPKSAYYKTKVHYGYVDNNGIYHADALPAQQIDDLSRDFASENTLNGDWHYCCDNGSFVNIFSLADAIYGNEKNKLSSTYSFSGAILAPALDNSQSTSSVIQGMNLDITHLAMCKLDDGSRTYFKKNQFDTENPGRAGWVKTNIQNAYYDVYIVFKENVTSFSPTFNASINIGYYHYEKSIKKEVWDHWDSVEGNVYKWVDATETVHGNNYQIVASPTPKANIGFYCEDGGRLVPIAAPYAPNVDLTLKENNGSIERCFNFQDLFGRYAFNNAGEKCVFKYAKCDEFPSIGNITGLGSYAKTNGINTGNYDGDPSKIDTSDIVSDWFFETTNDATADPTGVTPGHRKTIKVDNSSSYNEINVKIVFTKEDVVETLDSASHGINVSFFDYESWGDPASDKFSTAINRNLAFRTTNDQNYHNKWGEINHYKDDRSLTQGIYGNTLDDNGFPQLSNLYKSSSSPAAKDYGKSLSYLFNDKSDSFGYKRTYSNLNHLFLKDSYIENGEYVFNSSENFAQIDRRADSKAELESGNVDTKDFTVYKNPYCRIADEADIPYFSPLENKDCWRSSSSDFSWNNNYYYGMDMSFDFFQPVGGKVIWQKDESSPAVEREMKFDFTGDDDVCIYIDGALVLDLGGVHSTRSGSINFATGAVEYDSDCKAENTTIRDMFKAAGKENDVSWSKKNPNTFADNSSHSLKFFFFERGAYGSNCRIKFNLVAKAERAMQVGKQYQGDTQPVIRNYETDLFNVLVQKKTDENTYVNYESTEQIPVYLGKVGDDFSEADPIRTIDPDPTTGKSVDGVVKLRAGEVALLPKFQTEDQYRYVEFCPSVIGEDADNKWSAYGDGSVELDVVEYDAGSGKYVGYGNDGEKVTYDESSINLANNPLNYELRIHNVTPAGTEGPDAGTKTTTQFYLKYKDAYGVEQKYTGKYKLDGVEKTATDGILEFKSGENIVIENVEQGAYFKTEHVKSWKTKKDGKTEDLQKPIVMYPGMPYRIDYGTDEAMTNRACKFNGIGRIYNVKADNPDDFHSDFNMSVANDLKGLLITKVLNNKITEEDAYGTNYYNPLFYADEYHFYLEIKDKGKTKGFEGECTIYKNNGEVEKLKLGGKDGGPAGYFSIKAGESAFFKVDDKFKEGFNVYEYDSSFDVTDCWDAKVNYSIDPTNTDVPTTTLQSYPAFVYKATGITNKDALTTLDFNNNINPYTLRIKNVSDRSKEAADTFKIYFNESEKAYEGPYWIAKNGVKVKKYVGRGSTIPVHEGEEVWIENVIQGTKFKIVVDQGDESLTYPGTQTNIENWSVDESKNATGNILKTRQFSYSQFQFKLGAAPKGVTISKTISNKPAVSGSNDLIFYYYMQYKGAPYSGAYKIDDEEKTTSNGTFTLKEGQSALFETFDSGAKYQVVEYYPGADTGKNISSYYNTTINGTLQTQTKSVGPYTGYGIDLTDMGETGAEYTFSNDLCPIDLKINNLSERSKEQPDTFKLYFNNSSSSYVGKYYLDGEEKTTDADGTIKVGEGKSIVVKGIDKSLPFKFVADNPDSENFSFPGDQKNIDNWGPDASACSSTGTTSKYKLGSGEYCEFNFKFAPVVKGLTISKAIENEPAIINTNEGSFTYHISYDGAVCNQTSYTLIHKDTSTEETKTSASGVFTLKEGESAFFASFEADKTFSIVEYCTGADSIDNKWNVSINGVAQTEKITLDSAYTGYGFKDKTLSSTATDNVYTFTNDLSPYDLRIYNDSTRGYTSTDKIQVYFNCADNGTGGTLYKGDYYIADSKKTSTDGTLEFKEGETIAIKNVEQGTKFRIVVTKAANESLSYPSSADRRIRVNNWQDSTASASIINTKTASPNNYSLVSIKLQVKGFEIKKDLQDTPNIKINPEDEFLYYINYNGSAYASSNYTLINGSDETTLTTSPSGTFKLKAGQSARFDGFEPGKSVKVVEYYLGKTITDKWNAKIDGVAAAVKEIGGYNGFALETTVSEVPSDNIHVYSNDLVPFDFKVKNSSNRSSSDPDKIKIYFNCSSTYTGGDLYKGEYFIDGESTSLSTTDGIIEIAEGKTIVIKDVEQGVYFRTEVVYDGSKEKLDYPGTPFNINYDEPFAAKGSIIDSKPEVESNNYTWHDFRLIPKKDVVIEKSLSESSNVENTSWNHNYLFYIEKNGAPYSGHVDFYNAEFSKDITDGLVYLSKGQGVKFRDFYVGDTVQFVEYDTTNSVVNRWDTKINGSDAKQVSLNKNKYNGYGIDSSTVSNIDTNNKYTITNDLRTYDLKIKNVSERGKTDADSFNIFFNTSATAYSGKYFIEGDATEYTATDGVINVAEGKTVVIKSVEQGTAFRTVVSNTDNEILSYPVNDVLRVDYSGTWSGLGSIVNVKQANKADNYSQYSFKLQTNKLYISKEVVDNINVVKDTNKIFNYCIEYDGSLYANQQYTLIDGASSSTTTTDSSGCFTLKNGQSALFANVEPSKAFNVIEFISGADITSKWNTYVDGAASVASTKKIGSNTGYLLSGTVSDKISENSHGFKNDLLPYELRITNNSSRGKAGTDKFSIKFNGSASAYSGKYYIDNQEYDATSGNIDVAEGKTVVIKGVEQGTSFTTTVVSGDEKLTYPSTPFQITYSTPFSGAGTILDTKPANENERYSSYDFKLVPLRSVEVSKAVKNGPNVANATEQSTYYFYCQKNGSAYTGSYSINGGATQTMTNGLFTLTDGQKATLTDFYVDDTFNFIEYYQGSEADIFTKRSVKINGIDIETITTLGGHYGAGLSSAATVALDEDDNKFAVENYPQTYDLKVINRSSREKVDADKFKLFFNNSGTAYTGKYYIDGAEKDTEADGTINVGEGKTVVIKAVEQGTPFNLNVIYEGESLVYPQTDVKRVDYATTEFAGTGSISDAAVTNAAENFSQVAFKLQTQGLTISKTVENNINVNKTDLANKEYHFYIEYDSSVCNNEPYDLIVNGVATSKSTGADGTFVLKQNESAFFKNFVSPKTFSVVEYDPDGAITNTTTAKINGSVVSPITLGDYTGFGIKNQAINSDTSKNTYTFNNDLNPYTLKIENLSNRGKTSADKINLYINDTLYKGTYYIGESTTPKTSADGILEFKESEIIRIEGIEQGSSIRCVIKNTEREDKEYPNTAEKPYVNLENASVSYGEFYADIPSSINTSTGNYSKFNIKLSNCSVKVSKAIDANSVVNPAIRNNQDSDVYDFYAYNGSNPYNGVIKITHNSATTTSTITDGHFQLYKSDTAELCSYISSDKYSIEERSTNINDHFNVKVDGESAAEVGSGLGIKDQTFDGVEDANVHQFVNDLCLYDLKINNIGTNEVSKNITAVLTINGKPYEGAYSILNSSGGVIRTGTTDYSGKTTFTIGETILIENVEQNTPVKVDIINLDKPDYAAFSNDVNLTSCSYSVEDSFSAKIIDNKTPTTGTERVSSVDVRVVPYADLSLAKTISADSIDTTKDFEISAKITINNVAYKPDTEFKAILNDGTNDKPYKAKLDANGCILISENALDSYAYPLLKHGQKLTVKDIFVAETPNLAVQILEKEVDNYNVSCALGGVSKDMTTKQGNYLYSPAFISFDITSNDFVVTNSYWNSKLEIGKTIDDANKPQIERTEYTDYHYFVGIKHQGSAAYSAYSGSYNVIEGAIGSGNTYVEDTRTTTDGTMYCEDGQFIVIDGLQQNDVYQCFEYWPDSTVNISEKWDVKGYDASSNVVALSAQTFGSLSGIGVVDKPINGDGALKSIGFNNNLDNYYLEIANVSNRSKTDADKVKLYFNDSRFAYTGDYYIKNKEGVISEDAQTPDAGIMYVNEGESIIIKGIEQGVKFRTEVLYDDTESLSYPTGTSYTARINYVDPFQGEGSVINKKTAAPDNYSKYSFKLNMKGVYLSKHLSDQANVRNINESKDFSFFVSYDDAAFDDKCMIFNEDGEVTDYRKVNDGVLRLSDGETAYFYSFEAGKNFAFLEYYPADYSKLLNKWDIKINNVEQTAANIITLTNSKGDIYTGVGKQTSVSTDYEQNKYNVENNANYYDLRIINESNRGKTTADYINVMFNGTKNSNDWTYYNGTYYVEHADTSVTEHNTESNKCAFKEGEVVIIKDVEQGTTFKVQSANDYREYVEYPDGSRVNIESPNISNFVFTANIPDAKPAPTLAKRLSANFGADVLHYSQMAIKMSTNKLTVEKKVNENSKINPFINPDQSSDEYNFLALCGENGDEPYSGGITIYTGEESEVSAITDGKFTLKDGQKAELTSFIESDKYSIVEYIPNDDIDNYWIVKVGGTLAEKYMGLVAGKGLLERTFDASGEAEAVFDNDLFLYDFKLNDINKNSVYPKLDVEINVDNKPYEGTYYLCKEGEEPQEATTTQPGKFVVGNDESILIKGLVHGTRVQTNVTNVSDPNYVVYSNDIYIDNPSYTDKNPEFSGNIRNIKDPAQTTRLASIDVKTVAFSDFELQKLVTGDGADPEKEFEMTAKFSVDGAPYHNPDKTYFDGIIDNGDETTTQIIAQFDANGYLVVANRGTANYGWAKLSNTKRLHVYNLFNPEVENLSVEIAEKPAENYSGVCVANTRDPYALATEKDGALFTDPITTFDFATNGYVVTNSYTNRRFEVGKQLTEGCNPQIGPTVTSGFKYYVAIDKASDEETGYNKFIGTYKVYQGAVGETHTGEYESKASNDGFIYLQPGEVAVLEGFSKDDKCLCFETHPDKEIKIADLWDVSAKDQDGSSVDLKELKASEYEGLGMDNMLIPDAESNIGLQFTNNLQLYDIEVKNVGTATVSDNAKVKFVFDDGTVFNSENYPGAKYTKNGSSYNAPADGIISMSHDDDIVIKGVEQSTKVNIVVEPVKNPGSYANFKDTRNFAEGKLDLNTLNQFKDEVPSAKPTTEAAKVCYTSFEIVDSSDLVLTKVIDVPDSTANSISYLDDTFNIGVVVKDMAENPMKTGDIMGELHSAYGDKTVTVHFENNGLMSALQDDGSYGFLQVHNNDTFILKNILPANSLVTLRETIDNNYSPSSQHNNGAITPMNPTRIWSDSVPYTSLNAATNTFTFHNALLPNKLEIGKEVQNNINGSIAYATQDVFTYFLGIYDKDGECYPYKGEYTVVKGAVGRHEEAGQTKTTENGVINLAKDEVAIVNNLKNSDTYKLFEYLPDTAVNIVDKYETTATDASGIPIGLSNISQNIDGTIYSGVGVDNVNISGVSANTAVSFKNNLLPYDLIIDNNSTRSKVEKDIIIIKFNDDPDPYSGVYYIKDKDGKISEPKTATDGKIYVGQGESVIIKGVKQGSKFDVVPGNKFREDVEYPTGSYVRVDDPQTKDNNFSGKIPSKTQLNKENNFSEFAFVLSNRELKISKSVVSSDVNPVIEPAYKDTMYHYYIVLNVNEPYWGNAYLYDTTSGAQISTLSVEDGHLSIKDGQYVILDNMIDSDTYSIIEYLDDDTINQKWTVSVNGTNVERNINYAGHDGVGLANRSIVYASQLDFVNNLNLYDFKVENRKNTDIENDVPVDVVVKFNNKVYVGPIQVESEDGKIVDTQTGSDGRFTIEPTDKMVVKNVQQGTPVNVVTMGVEKQYELYFPEYIRIDDATSDEKEFDGKIQNTLNADEPFSQVTLKLTEEYVPHPDPDPVPPEPIHRSPVVSWVAQTFDNIPPALLIALGIILCVGIAGITIALIRKNKNK